MARSTTLSGSGPWSILKVGAGLTGRRASEIPEATFGAREVPSLDDREAQLGLIAEGVTISGDQHWGLVHSPDHPRWSANVTISGDRFLGLRSLATRQPGAVT